MHRAAFTRITGRCSRYVLSKSRHELNWGCHLFLCKKLILINVVKIYLGPFLKKTHYNTIKLILQTKKTVSDVVHERLFYIRTTCLSNIARKRFCTFLKIRYVVIEKGLKLASQKKFCRFNCIIDLAVEQTESGMEKATICDVIK